LPEQSQPFKTTPLYLNHAGEFVVALIPEEDFARYVKIHGGREPKKQFELGVEFYNHAASDDAQRNEYDKCAAECFRKAATLGHVPSLYNAGVCYLEGRGVQQNFTQAALWFGNACAADKTDVNAPNALGVSYLRDTSDPNNRGKAATCFRTAEKLGSTQAKENLAMFFPEPS